MLMMINPFDVLFGSDWDAPTLMLLKQYNYYILDTDDLSVECIDYNTLYNLVSNDVVSIINVSQRDKSVPMIEVWGFSLKSIAKVNMIDDIEVDNGNLVLRPEHGWLFLKDRKLLFSLQIIEHDVWLLVNDVKLCIVTSKACAQVSLEMAYVYKLNNYYIVRFRCELHSGFNYDYDVITVIINKCGAVVDVLFYKNTSTFQSKSLSFSAKFLSLIGERY